MKTTLLMLWALVLAAPAGAQAPIAIRPFAIGTVQSFTAVQTFDAVFGRSYDPFIGGGVQIVVDENYVIELTASRFNQTGQRAFLSGGQPFRLGIPLTATITPIEATIGYRFRIGRSPRVWPYAAAGGGYYLYKETSSFSATGEDLDTRQAGFVVNGGAEIRLHRWVGLAVDVQYSRVTGILGTAGVSQQAGETDLGGVAGRLKLIVGR